MRFPEPSVKVKFLPRPQRFLAVISFAYGSKTHAYCANPGSFNGCLKTGSAALLWDSADTRRKRRYTLRAVKLGRVWVGTDTHFANRLVEKALQRQLLPTLKGYPTLQRERPSGKGDFGTLNWPSSAV
jgi:sugar fermentation stimulation protein A